MFTLKERSLHRLCEINNFKMSENGMIFFGLRGCIPVNDENQSFADEHDLYLINVNNINPRCTIIQWQPKEKSFAVFPGSTAPHLKYIKKSKIQNGVGANQLMTGYYSDYRKGKHKAGSPTGHDAFRQTNGRPIRRTGDDFDYDNDDRVEFMNPNDNLHAGWCQSIDHDSFASAGCQVVVGYPQCKKYGTRPDIGPWKTFKENAYKLEQDSFSYVLLNGRDALKVSKDNTGKLIGRLRFGSYGENVEQLQKKLKEKGFYEGKVDKDFGRRSIRAVLEFQESVFGANEDDGVVGPNTALALGLTLDTFNYEI